MNTTKKWKNFGLNEGLIEALQDQNKYKPTKVQ